MKSKASVSKIVQQQENDTAEQQKTEERGGRQGVISLEPVVGNK